MARIVIFSLGLLIIVGISAFIYFFQKMEEESQELKNIIQNVHGKVENFKNSSGYNTVPAETKEILDYIDLSTSSTTAFGPSLSPLNHLRNLIHAKK